MAASSVPPVAKHAPRFLIVGAGGIGGVVAAHLTEQGHDVTTLTTNPIICDAINAQRLSRARRGEPRDRSRHRGA